MRATWFCRWKETCWQSFGCFSELAYGYWGWVLRPHHFLNCPQHWTMTVFCPPAFPWSFPKTGCRWVWAGRVVCFWGRKEVHATLAFRHYKQQQLWRLKFHGALASRWWSLKGAGSLCWATSHLKVRFLSPCNSRGWCLWVSFKEIWPSLWASLPGIYIWALSIGCSPGSRSFRFSSTPTTMWTTGLFSTSASNPICWSETLVRRPF